MAEDYIATMAVSEQIVFEGTVGSIVTEWAYSPWDHRQKIEVWTDDPNGLHVRITNYIDPNDIYDVEELSWLSKRWMKKKGSE